MTRNEAYIALNILNNTSLSSENMSEEGSTSIILNKLDIDNEIENTMLYIENIKKQDLENKEQLIEAYTSEESALILRSIPSKDFLEFVKINKLPGGQMSLLSKIFNIKF